MWVAHVKLNSYASSLYGYSSIIGVPKQHGGLLGSLVAFLNVVPYHAFAWVNIPTLPTTTVPPPVQFESIKKYLKPQFAKNRLIMFSSIFIAPFVFQELVDNLPMRSKS